MPATDSSTTAASASSATAVRPAPATRSGDLRAAHARRTRGAIRAAARLLTQDKGYAAMTVDEVAEMAGVSRRTVFNHFPTKADLLIMGPVPPGQDELDAFASGTGPLLEDLRALVSAGVDSLESEREDFRSVGEIIRDNPELKATIHARVREYADVVREAAARRLGTGPTDPRARAVADLAGMIQRAAVDLWSGRPDGAGPDPCGSPAPTGPRPESSHAAVSALSDAVATVVSALEEVLGLDSPAATPTDPGPAVVPDEPAPTPPATAAPAGTTTSPATTKEHA